MKKLVLLAALAASIAPASAQQFTTRQGLGNSTIISGPNGYNATIRQGLGDSLIGNDSRGNQWVTRRGLGDSTITTVIPGLEGNNGW